MYLNGQSGGRGVIVRRCQSAGAPCATGIGRVGSIVGRSPPGGNPSLAARPPPQPAATSPSAAPAIQAAVRALLVPRSERTLKVRDADAVRRVEEQVRFGDPQDASFLDHDRLRRAGW